MSATWIVTGATGYLGGRLVQRLLARGDYVIALVRPRVRGNDMHGDEHLPDAVHRVPIAADDTDLAVVLEPALALRGTAAPPPGVLHLAGVADFSHESGAGIAPLLAANVSFAARAADAAARLGADLFINTGSFAQHAAGDDSYVPNSLYAASKQAFETLLDHFQRRHGLRVATLRLYDVYGPDDPRPKLLNLLAALAPTDAPLAVTAGEQEMDPVHVDDVVDAYLACAEWLRGVPVSAPVAFGIRGGQPRTVREVAALAERVLGRELPLQWGARPYRREEIFHLWPSPAPPFWQPRRALESGLAELATARAHIEPPR